MIQIFHRKNNAETMQKLCFYLKEHKLEKALDWLNVNSSDVQ